MPTKTEILASRTLGDPRWAAVLARDPDAGGSFVYSVRTTGVYCRPDCAARAPRPENVSFHLTPDDAERAGFRACKRCRPRQPAPARQRAGRIAELCRLIERSDEPPALEDLAARAGLSAHHLHRVFKDVTGLTPRAYAAAHRARRLRDELRRSDTVTRAIHGAGYGSSARFYEESDRILGMTPGEYRAGGASTEIRFAVSRCSLGSILVARSGRGVCAILLGGDRGALERELRERFPRARFLGTDPGLERWVAMVVAFVEAPRLGLDLPLDIRGTAFQERVWRALREIPAGRTETYTAVARRIGSPRSVRAVARACASNPLAVAIPCHRVVRKDGGLAGYHWGIGRKRALLEREKPPAVRAPGRPRRGRQG